MTTKRRKYPKIGNAFKGLREEQECTQDVLASKIDILKPQISELENGKREPSIRELKAYSTYFNVPMEYLLGLSESRHYENIDISGVLGLSDSSIEILKDWKNANSPRENRKLFLINTIISHGSRIFQILNNILFTTPKGFLIEEKNKELAKIFIRNDDGTGRIFDIDQFEDFALFQLTNEIKAMKEYLRSNNIFPDKELCFDAHDEEVSNKEIDKNKLSEKHEVKSNGKHTTKKK